MLAIELYYQEIQLVAYMTMKLQKYAKVFLKWIFHEMPKAQV